MEKSKLLSELKGIAYDLIDTNGNFRTIPIGLVGSRKISEDRLSLLRTLMTLLRDTKIICAETKLYIFTRYITIKGVNQAMNELKENEMKQIPYNTTMSKIAYDRSKLERAFGPSIISDIILKTNNGETIMQHVNNITKAFQNYSGNKIDLRDNIALELDKSCLCSELSEEQFDTFIETILPYLKSHMKTISSNIDIDSVGYFNYLLYSPLLLDIDKQRLEVLKQYIDTPLIDDETIDIE